MGRPAGVAVVPVHAIPPNINNSTPNILDNECLLSSPLSDPSTQGASSGAPTSRGVPNHQTRSETSTRFSGQTPIASPPLILSSNGADPQLPNGIAPDTESLRVPAPALAQDSSFSSSPLPPPSYHPTSAFPPESSLAFCLPVWKRSQLATRLRLRPQVKACVLCTGGPGIPVLSDASLILQGLSRVRNVNPDHIIPRTSQLIDVALDKFFDPTDISEGAMLILIVSCHGLQGYGSNVLLQFKTQDGTIVDSRMLQDKIMALPKHCTLEVVVDTCIAENVIPGLRRISTMDPSAPCSMPAGVPNFVTAHTPPSGSRLNTMVSASSASSSAEPSASFPTTKLTKYASSFFEQDQPTYKAQVIVWAASTGSGKSFTEEHLPDKPGVYSILVGAIFNRLTGILGSNGPAISRRSVWENVLKVVEQHNDARCERDLCKPPEIRAHLKNRTQRAMLLTSVDDPDRVLNGLMFQPL